jgi:hypothetical protein
MSGFDLPRFVCAKRFFQEPSLDIRLLCKANSAHPATSSKDVPKKT